MLRWQARAALLYAAYVRPGRFHLCLVSAGGNERAVGRLGELLEVCVEGLEA